MFDRITEPSRDGSPDDEFRFANGGRGMPGDIDVVHPMRKRQVK
jgi:hypothetical protein